MVSVSQATLVLAVAAATWIPVVGLLILLVGLDRVFRTAPALDPIPSSGPCESELTVVIPAYNEEANISRCLSSVLRSQAPAAHGQILVVNDGSTDGTVEAANATLVRFATEGVPWTCRVIEAGPRPTNQRWVGKNWACARAMSSVTTPWVVFLDADVSVSSDALRRALASAMALKADLFSLAPRLVCGCLAEWMVQPIMASLLGLGFPMEQANDPESEVAFAAGPFMLFRRSAYEAIGGHSAVAGEVVEDLALARRIKQSGRRLVYQLGLDAVELQMYDDFSTLWEGWSKNWYLGLDRNVIKALSAGAVVFTMFTLPWLLLGSGLGLLFLLGPSPALWSGALAGAVGVLLQWLLRLWISVRFDVPLTFWWLMGVGGLIVAAIAPTSVWRSETGRGWTWKGRPLG